MNGTIALAGAAPALGLMWYFDRLDAKRPEPRSTLRRVAISGGIAVIPCAIIEYYLLQMKVTAFPSLWMIPLYLGAVAGFTEELAKVVCLRGWVWTRPEFDERMDGIVYATRAGLGFALVENILYLMGQKTAEGFLWIFILRAVLAVPGHAIYAGIMGYYAARRRFDKRGPGILGGFLIAAVLHTLYDAAIFSIPLVVLMGHRELQLPLLAVPVAIVVGGALVLRGMARRAIRDDDADASIVRAPVVVGAAG